MKWFVLFVGLVIVGLVTLIIYAFAFRIPELRAQCHAKGGIHELTRDGNYCWSSDGRRIWLD